MYPYPYLQLHDHGIAASSTSTYFVELWDVGGSPSHRKGRVAFYQQVHGELPLGYLTKFQLGGGGALRLTLVILHRLIQYLLILDS